MPELTAILLAEQYRAELLKAESASAVRLVNAYGTIYKRLLLQMDALTADLDRIAAKGEAPTRWQLQRLDRFRALKSQVLDEMQRYSAGVEIEIDQGARNAIAAAGKNGHDLVEASLPGVAEIDARIMASWQTLDTDAVETMVGFLDPRSPLKQGLRTMYGATIADGVERGLLESIALGYNPRKLAATFTRDLGMGLVSSLRLSRTVQLNAYREATRAGYAANPEIVKGWKRRATRDSRTCMACLSLDGSVHPVTERLADHWNGRCVALPMSIDYSDLGLDVPPRQPTDQWLASLPQDQQRAYLGPKRYDAWKSGELRFSETGRQWFERQSEAAQRAQMGPGKWEAWKAGKFGFEELSIRVPDRIWGVMRVETPLKTLLGRGAEPLAGAPTTKPSGPSGPRGGAALSMPAGKAGQVVPPIQYREITRVKDVSQFVTPYDNWGFKETTDREAKALTDYKAFEYRAINRALRGGYDYPSVAQIDSALSRAPAIPEDVKLYRGVAPNAGFGSLKPGTVIRDKGYVSTTFDRKLAAKFGHVIEIWARQGGRGAFIDYFGSDEWEMLLPRNATFRVVSDSLTKTVLEYGFE